MTTPSKLPIFRRPPRTVGTTSSDSSSSALPVGMRACGVAGGHAPAPGRPSSPVSKARCDGSAPDVFALHHPGAGILRLRHRRADPWVCGRPAAGAVSRRMLGDLHPWLHPWRHGWHAAPKPRQGRRRLGEVVAVFRRRARNAPDQVDERRAVYGRDLAGQPEAAPGIMLLAHHLAPQTESAKCTGKLITPLDASSVPGPRPWTTAQHRRSRAMEGAGDCARPESPPITLTSDGSWNPLTEPVSLKAATGIAGSVHHRS